QPSLPPPPTPSASALPRESNKLLQVESVGARSPDRAPFDFGVRRSPPLCFLFPLSARKKREKRKESGGDRRTPRGLPCLPFLPPSTSRTKNQATSSLRPKSKGTPGLLTVPQRF